MEYLKTRNGGGCAATIDRMNVDLTIEKFCCRVEGGDHEKELVLVVQRDSGEPEQRIRLPRCCLTKLQETLRRWKQDHIFDGG